MLMSDEVLRHKTAGRRVERAAEGQTADVSLIYALVGATISIVCLLYTSDAADEERLV